MTTGREWLCRLAGVASGLLMAAPHLYAAAAPLQAVALLPILYVLASRRVRHTTALAAGIYMGLAYTLPQLIVLQMPLPMTLTILLYLTALITVFAWASSQLLRGSAVTGAFAVGAILVVLDWVNFTMLPIWGTAQSLVRPWSHYPGLVLFVSFTGITGIIFVLGTLQALLINLIVRPKQRVRVLAAAVVVGLLFLAANVVVRCRQPIGKLKVAAVGWTHADSAEFGDIHSAEGFDTLFVQPAAQAAGEAARLIVFPEMAFCLYENTRRMWLERFREIARRHNVFLAIGYFSADDRENRCLFMAADGTVASEYTKTYLTAFENYRKGQGQLASINVEGVRVGGMICQDDNFTRLSRSYGRKRTSVMAVPTNDWLQVKDVHLQGSIHRAIESRYAIVRAAMNGISAIVSPTGKVLARRDHFRRGPGVVVADVPVYAIRTIFSTLSHWPAAVSAVFLLIYTGWNFVGRRLRNLFWCGKAL